MAAPAADLRWRLQHLRGLSPAAGVALQRVAAGLVRATGEPVPGTVAGIDVSVRGEVAAAAVAVLSFPDLLPLAEATASAPVTFPYVPGLLAIREVPVVLAAFAGLPLRPDLLLVDGQGLAHPRRFGIACHLGVALDLPAIGVGKTRLLGEHRQPGRRRGCRTRLVDGGEVVGAVLRTRDSVRPVYVSVGHRLSLQAAVRLVLRCCRGFRLPEPLRAAHAAAGRASAGLPARGA